MTPGFIVGGKCYTTTQVGAHSDQSDVLAVMGTPTETSEQLREARDHMKQQTDLINRQTAQMKQQTARIEEFNQQILERVNFFTEKLEWNDERDLQQNIEIEEQKVIIAELKTTLEMHRFLITELTAELKKRPAVQAFGHSNK
jgi:predicted RNase H-like nuclease (RuvC/YqgF family)